MPLLVVQISKTTLQSSVAISGKDDGARTLKRSKHTSNMCILPERNSHT